jgi:undecaprenyl-diphosphatase
MDPLIVGGGQYLLYAVPFVALVVWWRLDRVGKISLGTQLLVALVLLYPLVTLAGLLWTDPRPFIVDPSIVPPIPHSSDNGFPSDHTAAAAMVAVALLAERSRVGWWILGVAALIGSARVVAGVHHVPDVLGGLVVGAGAAALAVLLWRLVGPPVEHLGRRAPAGPA